MKKITLFVAATCFCFASCKNDYTCTCTVPASGSQPAATHTYEVKEVRKSRAKGACTVAGDRWVLAGGKCDLKKD